MLMVILGAGASFDSVDLGLDPSMQSNPQFRPPLAQQLFEPRPNFTSVFDSFPDLGAVVNRVRRVVARGELLENELRRIEDEATAHPIRHRQLLAMRCYLQRIVFDCGSEWGRLAHGITYYAELIDIIEQWHATPSDPVVYVTFNYDLMLESALSVRHRTQWTDIDALISHPNFRLLKLHGSVDWGQLVHVPSNISDDTNAITRYLFEEAGNYEVGEYVVARPPLGTFEKAGIVPALAMPVQGKSTFACPDEHLSVLKSAIAYTTKIVTIGWRGLEEHFLSMWKNRNDFFDLFIVSGSKDDGVETLRNLEAGGMLNPVSSGYRREIFDGGFGGAVGSGAIHGFLHT